MNVSAPKSSAAKATLRQLAVLGLPGPMLREALAKAVLGMIPGDMVCFMRHAAPDRLADAWINTPELLPELGVFLTDFYDRRETEAYRAYRDFLRSGPDLDLLHGDSPRLLRSAVYNELYRGIDFRFLLRAAFREGGIATGCLTLTRGHRGKDFSRKELRLITQIVPYVVHALRVPTEVTAERPCVDVAEGQLICDERGTIEHLSVSGRTLLHDLAEVPMTAATLSDHCLAWAGPHLRRLVGEAAKLAGGRNAAIPAMVRDNARGRYVLRVWQLTPVGAADAPRLYSVSIRRYVPLALRLLECPAVVALPGREKQIALLMAEGGETREIADRLGLTVNTVISNIRSLYGRLGIGGRGELLPALMGSGPGTAAH